MIGVNLLISMNMVSLLKGLSIESGRNFSLFFFFFLLLPFFCFLDFSLFFFFFLLLPFFCFLDFSLFFFLLPPFLNEQNQIDKDDWSKPVDLNEYGISFKRVKYRKWKKALKKEKIRDQMFRRTSGDHHTIRSS
jgi:hypothetical protein